jgi:hypothetical protein
MTCPCPLCRAQKPLGRGESAEMRASSNAIAAMKQASGFYNPPPPKSMEKWMALGGGRGRGRRMLGVVA